MKRSQFWNIDWSMSIFFYAECNLWGNDLAKTNSVQKDILIKIFSRCVLGNFRENFSLPTKPKNCGNIHNPWAIAALRQFSSLLFFFSEKQTWQRKSIWGCQCYRKKNVFTKIIRKCIHIQCKFSFTVENIRRAKLSIFEEKCLVNDFS